MSAVRYPFARAAIAAFALLPHIAFAQDFDAPREDVIDEEECQGPCTGPRTLGGHTYVPSTLVDFPFIVSRVASTTSAGATQLEIASAPVISRLGIEGTSELVYIDQILLGSYAIRPWISVGVRAQGSLVVPSSTVGAVLVGEHGMYGGTATGALRLVRTDRLQATAIVDATRFWPNSLVPARIPGSPFLDGNITSLRPAIALAYTATPRIGLQASASYALQWFDIIESDLFQTITAGAALTIDVRAIPLAIVLAGQYAHEFGETATMDATDAVFGLGESRVWGEAGLVYRQRPELDLGVAVDWMLNSGDESRRFAQLRFAYYFL
jgi:hypothetical protein